MSLLSEINTLGSWANESRLLLHNVEDNLDWRTVSAYDLTKNGGIGYIAFYNRLVLSELIESVQWFVYGYASSFNYSYWPDILIGLYHQGAGEPYELTAEKICLAWAADNFQARALTIAFIDRMRQLIWDEPFFVAWAARPE